jgi:hypothetical protein
MVMSMFEYPELIFFHLFCSFFATIVRARASGEWKILVLMVIRVG